MITLPHIQQFKSYCRIIQVGFHMWLHKYFFLMEVLKLLKEICLPFRIYSFAESSNLMSF